MLTDEELIWGYAKTGNQDLFAELYHRLKEKLTATLVGWGIDFETASDIIQETFLNVHLHCRSFREESSACTWITSIALNLARTYVRSGKFQRRPQLEDTSFFVELIDYRQTHAEEIADQQERDNINRLLETELDHKHAEVIRLLDIEGLDYEDAAEQLHIPVGTVRSRRHRAVNRLRQLMAAMVLLAVGVCDVFGADPTAPTFARKVTVQIIHDGDTVKGSLDLGYGLSLQASIRAYAYDCWELGRQREQVIGHISDAEIKKGIAARDDLIDLLKTHDLYAEDSGESDPHGRNSSILWARPKEGGKWVFLAAWMEQRGHLRTPRMGANE